MGNYRKNLLWNDKVELACMIIFKKLEKNGFIRGMQNQLIEELKKDTKYDLPSNGSLSAKVANFKSVSGINNHSNASQNTKNIYEAYNNCSVEKLEEIYSKSNPTDNLLQPPIQCQE